MPQVDVVSTHKPNHTSKQGEVILIWNILFMAPIIKLILVFSLTLEQFL